MRAVLNYGHTIGHALEAATGYARFLHGEAVAIGLVGAALIAERLGLIDGATVERHRWVLKRFGLPTGAREGPRVEPAALLEAIRSDKKVSGGRVRWVLLESVGSPLVGQEAPEAVVGEVLAQLCGS